MTEFAKEYGEGLYELAAEENIREEVHAQLNALAECFRQDPDFIRLLATPSIRLEERFAVLEEVFRDKVHPYVINFMKILCERGAAGAFAECAAWFHRRFNEDFGLTEARVVTAVPLTEASARALREKLERVSGKKVTLIESVDPSLLGGVRVEMDGHRLENSIRMRLDQLRRDLTESL